MVSKRKIENRKKNKLTEDEKEELLEEGELPKKSIINRENYQLVWFFVIIGIIFASFLIPYFWIESTKTFDYIGVNWVTENYPEPTGTIYHGRFISPSNPNLMYNIFLRGDPRRNNVVTEGTFDKFKYGGVISFSSRANACRGELSRVMLDLGSFLKQGIGIGVLDVGYTDKNIANESGKTYATCDNIENRTIVIVKIGDSKVIQNKDNPFCYTIYVNDCNDVSSVEKFMIKSIEDFGRTK